MSNYYRNTPGRKRDRGTTLGHQHRWLDSPDKTRARWLWGFCIVVGLLVLTPVAFVLLQLIKWLSHG